MPFKEDSDPVNDLEIGMVHSLKDWLNKNLASFSPKPYYRVELKQGIYVISGKGSMVLGNYDIPEDFRNKIKFEMDGPVTIINELSSDDIYKRMRGICRGILEIPKEELENQKGSLTEERIEKSKKYILGLPHDSTLLQKVDLINSVKQGILEFAHEVSDNFGIKLGDYAKILKTKLN